MDPLSALRDFTIRGEIDKIVQSGDVFHFGGDYTFPCAAVTSYRSKQGGHYTLETLLHFLRNHHLKHVDYLQSARLSRVPLVTLPDHRPLLDYLTGKVSSTDAVEPPAAAAVEEYRPDEPSLPGLPSATDPSFPIQIDAEAGFRGPDLNLDYVSMIRALERPLKDRESLLECRNRNFLELLEASTKREEERQRLESQQRKDELVARTRLTGADPHHRGMGGYGDDPGSTPKPKLHAKGGKTGEGVPIILVPSAFQTLITIYNVKDFLEDGVFVPTSVKLKAMPAGATKPDRITVQKKLGSRDRVTAYEVRDKTSSFKEDEWNRVVAVFVLGKEWQFKDWRKDPVEIFNNVIGFYVHFEDDSAEAVKIVKQWNVKSIPISKNKRHQDKAAALEVWEKMENFIRSRSHS